MEGDWDVGFRFHPTEEEIIKHFLEFKMSGFDFPDHPIADVVDVCQHEPWDLPNRSLMPKKDRVWYFFNAPVSKYANSKRVKRTTNCGYWKPTGKDRVICDEDGKEIGFKKNLVFHRGHVPNGIRTNWVMHEYHSRNASFFPKEFVLFRLKKKSDDKPDARNEQTPQRFTSDSGNRDIENSNPQRNLDFREELLLSDTELDYNLLADSNGLRDDTFSELPSNIQLEQGTCDNSSVFDQILLSTVQPERGASYPDGFNSEPSFLNDSYFETSEQEDAFVNSLWADQGESIYTLRHDFNPTRSLTRRHIGLSSNADSKISEQHGKFRALSETSSSSEGYDIMDFDISSVNSDTDLPGIFGHESVVDELQHTPKYHKFEAKCATRELQMQRIVPNKAVSKVEKREAVHHAVDLPGTEKATVRVVRDNKMAQKTRATKNSNSSSIGSTSSNKKELCVSSLTAAFDRAGSGKTPQLSHQTVPPSVYLLNVLVSLVLILVIILGMAYIR